MLSPIVRNLKNKLKSGPVNSFFNTFFVHEKGVRVSDQCVSCGKCGGYSLNNIDLVDGKPVKEAVHTVWPVSGVALPRQSSTN